MTKNYKKDILNQIVDSEVFGSAVANNLVRFAYTNNIAKIASSVAGQIVFYADTTNKTGVIAVGGDIVSSKILNVTKAATANGVTGENTLTVTYVDTTGTTPTTSTITLDVIDKAAAKTIIESYAQTSSTIYVDSSTKQFEVKIKEAGGIAVDNSGLYVDLDDVFEVDEKTIGFDATTEQLKTLVKLAYNASGNASKPAIQLQNVDDECLSEVTVEQIIGSGIVDHTEYDSASNILHIYWKNPSGSTAVVTDIDLSAILDINDWAVKSDSTDFLNLTVNASTAEIGVKKATVTYSATSGDTPANLTATTTNGEVVVASTAIPAIKSYVDDIAENIAVSAQGDSYVNAAVNSSDKKKIDVSANVGELTVTTAAGVDSTIAGVANKLVDGSEVATKVSTFVNARISEEVAKLDSSAATADLSTTVGSEVYVKVTGEFVDGKFKSTDGLTVATQIASTTKTDYVPASGETPATDPSLVIATGGLVTDKDVTKLIGYINDKVEQLQDEEDDIFEHIDSTVGDADAANFVSIEVVQVDASLNSATVDVSYGAYSYTAGTHEFGTATNGIAKVSDTQTFVQNVVESLDLLADAQDASAVDSSNFIKTTISQTDGIVKNESVEVTYTNVSASASGVTVTADGIAKGSDIKNVIEHVLVWEVLD